MCHVWATQVRQAPGWWSLGVPASKLAKANPHYRTCTVVQDNSTSHMPISFKCWIGPGSTNS